MFDGCSEVHENFKIRSASEEDWSAILALQNSLNRPVRADSVATEFVVAITDSIVGCGAVRKRGGLGYLYGLAVSKKWRKQGIGHALTQQRLDWLRVQGVTSVFVLAMFWNIKFFRKHGFELVPKSLLPSLLHLHGDFSQHWSARSALLSCNLPVINPTVNG